MAIPDFMERLGELLTAAELDLAPGPWQEKLPHLYRQIVYGNREQNLTRITGQEDFLVKHLVDSYLVLHAVPELATMSGKIADVGCGAGIPGLPLALLNQQASFTEIDSSRKKVDFVHSLIHLLELKERCVAIHGNSRELGRQPELHKSFDVVLSRAVCDTPTLIKSCRQLLAPTGFMVAFKTPAQVEAERELTARDARNAKLSVEESPVYSLPDGAGDRQFVRLSYG